MSDCKVYLAPMAGITDRAMRTVLAECGPVNMITEMAAINALQRENPKSLQIIDVKNEPYPVAVQLVGNSPELFAEAARLAADLGAASIDINMGCPVKKIVNNGAGSALMRNLPLASDIIESIVKAVKLPVTVKFRKGWDNSHVNAVEFAKMCEESGASRIAVHGRTKAQGYTGFADWDIIREVKSAVKIPVIGNGDITSPQEAAKRIAESGVDGVMIGRAVLGNPWLPGQTDRYLRTGELAPEPAAEEIQKVMLDHLQLLAEYYGEKSGIAVSRKHMGRYIRGFHDARKFREQYNKLNTLQEAEDFINGYFAEVKI